MRTLTLTLLAVSLVGCGTLSDKVDDLRSQYASLKAKAQDVCKVVEDLPVLDADDAGVPAATSGLTTGEVE